MMHPHAIWALLLLAFGVPAHANVAVCKDPRGRIIGMPGSVAGGKRIDVEDGMSGGVFTFRWTKGVKAAQVVAMGTPPSSPQVEDALVVFESPAQVTFLVLHSSSVWLYSVYPALGRMVLTAHNDGLAGGTDGAVAKVFDGACQVTLD